MVLSRTTPCNAITIFSPRWHDKVALIAQYKVGNHNEITFKVKQYPGKYYLSGETIRKYPLGTNGTIPCYEVSLKEFNQDSILERK